MAYNNFKKIDQVRKAFGRIAIQKEWLPNELPQVKISHNLLENLADNTQEGAPRFLKLENNKLFTAPSYVPLTFTEPHRVLATLEWILDESLK